MEQLMKIYEEGMYNNPELDKGILVFQCSEKENKMDVQFMNDDMLLHNILNRDSLNAKTKKPYSVFTPFRKNLQKCLQINITYQ